MKVPANAIQHYWNTTSPLIQNAPSLSDCRSNEISCIHTCSPAVYGTAYESYVYWTVHHLDGWINRDQLDVTCFFISLFNAQHVSDVNTSILRSLRLVCWVISWVVLLWCFNLHPDTTPPQPNHNLTPKQIEPEQYNSWNNSTNKSQAPEDGCINIWNMLSSK